MGLGMGLRASWRRWVPAVPGAALAAMGLTLFVCSLEAPWLWSAGQSLHRADLLPTAVPYEQRLLQWPLWACAALAVTGMAWVLLEHLPAARRFPRWALDAALAIGAGAGFILALMGARWLGFFFARAWDPGPTPLRLHVVPYLDLAFGLGAIALCLVALKKRRPAWLAARGVRVALVCATGLLALPLLPFATAPVQGGSFHFDELTLEGYRAADQDGPMQAARDLATARALLWATLLSGIAAVALEAPARQMPPLRHARWLPALPAAACAIVTVFLYVHLPELVPTARIGYNPFLPLTLLALVATVAIPALGRLHGKSRFPKESRNKAKAPEETV